LFPQNIPEQGSIIAVGHDTFIQFTLKSRNEQLYARCENISAEVFQD